MRLKLDENLSRHLAPHLAALHHDVATAADEGLLGSPDSEIAAAAAAEGRILLSLDVGFGDLGRFPPGTHPGIVVFRPRSLGPRAVAAMVLDFVAHADLDALARCLVMVEPLRTRVRRPPDPTSP